MRRARSEPPLPYPVSSNRGGLEDKRRPYRRRRGGSCTLPERRREYGFAEGQREVPGPGMKVKPQSVIARSPDLSGRRSNPEIATSR